MKKTDAILVSFDNTHGDTALLLVGRKGTGEAVKIINAITGPEAEELYKRLVERKK